MSINDMAMRDDEAIDREIEALQAECDSDLAAGKKTYPANCIRLDIALLRRDIYIIARGVLEMQEALSGIPLVVTEQKRLGNALDIVQAAMSHNIRLLESMTRPAGMLRALERELTQ